MNPRDLLYVAGPETLIGAALLRRLRAAGYERFCGLNSSDVDLTDRHSVNRFFSQHQPAYIFVAAGKQGGIAANQQHPADLMWDNLAIAVNLLDAAHKASCRKLLYLGSSCIYPKICAQPMLVDALMTGPMEPTSESYSTAKLAGMKLCEAYRKQYGCDFVVGIPANVFGIEDDFVSNGSHVVGALIHRMHTAKESKASSVTVWGTGAAQRDFIFADDLADACILVMQQYSSDVPINLGNGQATSIGELARLIREVAEYTGELIFDSTKPEGAPLKELSSQAITAMGWRPRTSLREALEVTYVAYLQRLEMSKSARAASV